MKQQAFRLEPVLRIRRIQERAAAVAAAAAAAQASQADEVARAADLAAAEAPVPDVCTGAGLVAHLTRGRLLAADASAARDHARQVRVQADTEMAAWTTAAQHMKGLERLKDRHQAGVQAAAANAEARTVDDIVTRAYAVRRHTEGQGY